MKGFRRIIFTAYILLVICIYPYVHDAFSGDKKTNKASMEDVKQVMADFSHLPLHCQIRLTEREFQYIRNQELPEDFKIVRDKWLKRVGKAWYASHHLCWGIEKYQQAITMKYDDPWRNSKFKQVLSELNFVRNSIKGRGGGYYGLWLELLNYEYQTYIMLGEAQLAQKTLKEIEFYKKQQTN